MKRIQYIFVLVCAMSLAGCTPRGVLKIPKNIPVDRTLYDPAYADAADAAEAILLEARKDLGVPGLSAAVSVKGKTVWAGAVGWADVTKGVPATRRTKFRIGSTSKAVTATGLARLVDAGVIDLDVPIGAYMEDMPNPKWIRMTPRQLASHTAGLPGYEENSDRAGAIGTIMLMRQYDDVVEALDVFDGAKLLYEPGEGFHYSSFDVNLLSAVMQSATGTPFLELLDRQVFRPLEMASTHADFQDRSVPGRAVFYDRAKRGVKPWRHVNLSLKWASGGLVSTSSDLVKLGAAWFDPGFIRSDTRRIMWTPQRLKNGEVNIENYALGWRSDTTTRVFGEERPIKRVHHGGVSKGAMSWLVLYPEYEMVVALNINARAETFQLFAAREAAITRAFMGVAELR